jgi:hypothetical protein
MPDYLILMHDDVPPAAKDASGAAWEPYFGGLIASGNFQGGSSIGTGICIRKAGAVPEVASHLTGFIRVRADSFDHARTMVAGNPDYEAGGSVEIRELPEDG